MTLTHYLSRITHHCLLLSRRMVTGPLFTSETSIMAWKNPCFYRYILFFKNRHKIFIQLVGKLRFCGIHKRRPSPFAAIPHEGELGDHQNFSLDVQQRTVHFAGIVFKYPEIYNFIRQIVCIFGCVSSWPTPSNTSNPWPMLAVFLFSMVTALFETLWMTVFMGKGISERGILVQGITKGTKEKNVVM